MSLYPPSAIPIVRACEYAFWRLTVMNDYSNYYGCGVRSLWPTPNRVCPPIHLPGDITLR